MSEVRKQLRSSRRAGMKPASSLSKAQIARIASNVGIPVATAAAHITRTKAAAAHVCAMTHNAVVLELHTAGHIIRVLLNVMTPEQKTKCASTLDRQGIPLDGMTRFQQRLAALKSAGAA